MPSRTSPMPKWGTELTMIFRILSALRFCATLKVVNPQLMSERDVPMTAINVRLVPMPVFWNARLVFWEANLNERPGGGRLVNAWSLIMAIFFLEKRAVPQIWLYT